ncbi:hypothetical protein [Dysgonomonas sp. 25]|uniref:hypothetical protein n=1 Tax=Dysgonomonas sp. 25 TaxID=2302933 RepID=UPI0013D31039|nr:hypothetical protein [Dysgonomonas sp. 25]NDV68353.1 hypothetical protein [Dysgonomonas sp. 25]
MGGKIRFVLLFALLSFFVPEAYSQACGGGTFTFCFYMPQGTNVDEMTYNVYRLNSEKEIDEFRFAYVDRQLDLERGSVIDNSIIDKFLKEHPDVAEFYLYKNPDPDGFPYLKGRDPAASQVVRDGKLEFMTIETGYTPCILKVNYGASYFYVVANLYGGCNRTTEIVVRDNGTAVVVIPKDYRED